FRIPLKLGWSIGITRPQTAPQFQSFVTGVKTVTRKRIVRTSSCKVLVVRATVVALLVFVAGLATLAKNSQYLPKTNPARYLSIASKMKADTDVAPARVSLEPAQPCSRLELHRPVLVLFRINERETPFVQRCGLLVCIRHRAPPFVS